MFEGDTHILHAHTHIHTHTHTHPTSPYLTSLQQTRSPTPKKTHKTPLQDHFSRLRTAYPGAKLLIVSNTAGTTTSDPTGTQAAALESRTGVTVLRHSTKKPGCANEVLEYFLKKHPETGVKRPDQIAVVGDRLATDVVMANLMGGYAVWVRDGVQGRGFVSRVLFLFFQLLHLFYSKLTVVAVC